MSDNEQDERIFEIELAKNGRAGCKKCKQKCLQGVLRLAKIAANPFGDGKMKNWHHTDCLFEAFKKQRATTKRIESEEDIIGFDSISSDEQNSIRDRIQQLNQFFGVTKKPHSKKITQANSETASSNPILSRVHVVSDSTPDDLFKTFQKIVKKVANHPSYLDKTGIIKTFFEKGTSGDGFKGDVEVWCRLLLPGSVKRIYNLQSKQLVKVFSRIFLEDHEEMLEHLEQGKVKIMPYL